MTSHRFATLTIDVDFANRADADHFQNRISRFCSDDLPEILQAQLGDVSVHADRVELDLGDLSRDRLENDIATRLVDALRALNVPPTESLKTPRMDDIGDNAGFIHFLRTGRIPVSASHVSEVVGGWIESVLCASVPDKRRWLQKVLEDPAATQRLVRTVPSEQFLRLLTSLGLDVAAYTHNVSLICADMGWASAQFEPYWRHVALKFASAETSDPRFQMGTLLEEVAMLLNQGLVSETNAAAPHISSSRSEAGRKNVHPKPDNLTMFDTRIQGEEPQTSARDPLSISPVADIDDPDTRGNSGLPFAQSRPGPTLGPSERDSVPLEPPVPSSSSGPGPGRATAGNSNDLDAPTELTGAEFWPSVPVDVPMPDVPDIGAHAQSHSVSEQVKDADFALGHEPMAIIERLLSDQDRNFAEIQDHAALVARIETALTQYPDKFIDDLRCVEAREVLVSRLIVIVPFELLARLISLLVPTHKGWLLDMLKRAGGCLPQGVSGRLWQLVLRRALEPNDPALTEKQFSGQMVQYAARIAAVAPVDIVERLLGSRTTSAGTGSVSDLDHLLDHLQSGAAEAETVPINQARFDGLSDDAEPSVSEPGRPPLDAPLALADMVAEFGPLAALMRFLRYGQGVPGDQLANSEALVRFLDTDGDGASQMMYWLATLPATRMRLAQSTTSAVRTAVLAHRHNDSSLISIVQDLDRAIAELHPEAQQIVSHAFYEALFSTTPASAKPAELLRIATETVAARLGRSRVAILQALLQSAAHAGSDEFRVLLVAQRATVEVLQGRALPDPLQIPDMLSQSPSDARSTAMRVSLAGLVLIWPFVPQYFAHLGTTKHGRFCTPEHQNRSVYLLHHLATGTHHAADHDLTLAKVLCGLEPVDPIWPSKELNDEEIRLIDHLLTTVTERWPGLENTSVAGLRGSFLCRAGRLVDGDESLMLTVDSAPYDMLLNNINWPFSMVRFDWMTRLLQVDWGLR
ncbi:contractile injection system tape measure protein [uncultured Ruegeria sp.]|uniref:contractile injection system tape measure protein n=1 Tax=uncultured Ruegeria sp. TaxID=259304 RepID=UPI00260588EF|nr:contractile injection system tape measure protein [uncultured Ruegeria sp.]